MDVTQETVSAIRRREWGRLRLLLHPYVRWTDAGGRAIRGRKNVLAHLERSPPDRPPASHELRDGQVYRWVE